jgi:hypothetical protein
MPVRPYELPLKANPAKQKTRAEYAICGAVKLSLASKFLKHNK